MARRGVCDQGAGGDRARRTLVLIGIAALFLLPWIGKPALIDRDETYYAEAAREMRAAGTWTRPLFNGQTFTQKPFLPMALIRTGYEVFGVSELGARIPSAILGLGTVVLAATMGRSFWSHEVGFRAGLILCSSLLFLFICRSALTDSAFLFFFTASLVFFLAGSRANGYSLGSLAGMYGSAALAALCKGPVGFLLPVAIAAVVAWGDGGLRSVLRLYLPWGAVFLVVATLPWYLGTSSGPSTLMSFLWRENVGRFLSPMEGHRGPFWIYVPVLLLAFLPWSVFAPQAMTALGDRRARRALVAWIAIPLVFFSVAATKLPHYILPVFPPLALLVSAGWPAWSGATGWRRFLPLISLLLLTSGFPLAAILAPALWRAFIPRSLVLTVAVLPLGAAAALLTARWPRVVFVSLLFSMGLFGSLSFGWSLPALGEHRVVPLMGRLLNEVAGVPTYSYRFLEPGLLFYGGRTIERLESPDQVARLARRGRFVIVVREQDASEVRRAAGVPLRVIGIRNGFCEDSGLLTLIVMTGG